MKDCTGSRNRRRRPRTRKIRRHREQPRLWPEGKRPRPVFRQRQIRIKREERGETTSYGGLALAHQLAMRLDLDRELNERLSLLKLRLPFYESDHVLAQVYNLYVGGRCIEDLGHLQHSDAIKGILGACRMPDPTTSGDFLRRFGEDDLAAMQDGIDATRQRVWRKLPSRRRRQATIDLDSTIKEVYGECKQGADFSYTGKWSYHPLLATLAETNEPLRTVNRPGNVESSVGSDELLRELLPTVGEHFGEVFVRGDNAFCKRSVMAACEAHGARFAFPMDRHASLIELAESLPDRAWKPFSADKNRTRSVKVSKSRRKRPRYRKRTARKRRYKTLRTTREWVAESTYVLPRVKLAKDFDLRHREFRVVIRRQRVETSRGQDVMFTEYRYTFIITNIPRRRMSAAEVVRFAYGRCDQENTIEQLKNGIGALRMPTGTLLANAAFLMMGQVAWCLRSWLSLLALPPETLRWEWAWYRHVFVYVAAKVTTGARRAFVHLTGSHRFVEHLLTASARLQCFEFT